MLKIEMAGAYSTCWEKRSVFRVLMGKRGGKRPHVKHRLGLEYNIRMEFQEVACGGKDWIKLAQNSDSWYAFVNEGMRFRVP
jgi:hypothetical protein